MRTLINPVKPWHIMRHERLCLPLAVDLTLPLARSHARSLLLSREARNYDTQSEYTFRDGGRQCIFHRADTLRAGNESALSSKPSDDSMKIAKCNCAPRWESIQQIIVEDGTGIFHCLQCENRSCRRIC